MYNELMEKKLKRAKKKRKYAISIMKKLILCMMEILFVSVNLYVSKTVGIITKTFP